jgi:hypothetical protein
MPPAASESHGGCQLVRERLGLDIGRTPSSTSDSDARSQEISSIPAPVRAWPLSYWTESGFRKESERSAARFMESRSVALDPIAAAPDAQMREVVDDFLASPGTRTSYASDLAIFLGWMAARGPAPAHRSRGESV